jgi:small basic protein
MAARRPSKLGFALTFCLLGGLLVWRFAVPKASPWLNLAVLLAVAALLFGLRGFLQKK